MATLLLQAAGSFLGGFLGPVGAVIGSAAGATAGYLVDRALIDSTQHYTRGKLASAAPFAAEDGAPIPRVYGAARVGGTMIWATRFEESRKTKRQGFKGGASVTTYSYFANVAFLLCEGEIAGLRRIWAHGRELDQTLYEIRVYQGTEDQQPDPLIEAKQGSGNTPAYRGSAYIIFEHFPLGDYGNRIPQFQFEVLKPAGDLHKQIRAVALIPGATEYGLSPDPITYAAQKGASEAVNRHVLTARSDLVASLDELQALCPNVENIGLVVTWFGNDLRAGQCAIRPMVTQADPHGFSQDWKVSGIERADASVVSMVNGAAAYGGTPSDRTVMDAIAEIRGRGLKVTLYPFMMMDIPAGNSLPDPYGGAAQAAYPWRGRITSALAPGLSGTSDKTAAVRAEIAAFCGDAAISDFATQADTIPFSGNTTDWGYRRLILHYAHLAVAAGGVDSFLLGSEMRGLTTLRDAANAFPFVEALAALAADARSVLGAATKITYGADWSEYFGYHPPDGSNDVFFHLDPLWSHTAIDAVGIDNYMPLSDWRDADYAGGNPDGFSGPYDPDGLRAAVAGGEGYDWYYESSEARSARQRSAITDGAFGKPWVFRYKDILNWWSNNHYNRVAGVEASTPTAWAPQSKPVWFSEFGCPAVDKGPNQPNVFPDPKSSESAVPYFSSGGRSDLAQHRFLSAHYSYWDPASAAFDPAQNPVSSVYGGQMVDMERLYVWAWDARPFPAFPLLSDAWSDGADWFAGHWLNGRLASPEIGDLANAILGDHGLPAAEVSKADGSVAGYVVSHPDTARSTLEPLSDLFGLSAFEQAGDLVFMSENALATTGTLIDEMVAADGGTPAMRKTRDPDHALPASAMLQFQDPLNDYQAASARRRRSDVSGAAEQTIGFSGVLETGQADALVADWLRRDWAGREQIDFALPAGAADALPGSIVSLTDAGGTQDYVVAEIDEGLTRRVSARRIERVAPFPWRTGLPAYASLSSTIVGEPLAHFLDLPMNASGVAPESRFCAAVWSKPWKSEVLYASPEDTGFGLRSTASLPAIIGELADPLEGAFSGRIDFARTITVRLYDGELQSISRLQMLNGANVAAVLTASGVWEVLQFENAVETAPSVWTLSGLLRGQLGTDDAMRAGAVDGAPFVLIDDAIFPAGLRSSEIGLLLNWRVGPAGYDFSSLAFSLYSETGGVRALTPLSPVHLEAERQDDGSIAVGWIRRGRVDADNWLGADIPLGEEYEAYQVDVSAAGNMVRSTTISSPSWTYPSSDLSADFPSLPEEIEITVRQVSASVGPGLPASCAIPLR